MKNSLVSERLNEPVIQLRLSAVPTYAVLVCDVSQLERVVRVARVACAAARAEFEVER